MKTWTLTGLDTFVQYAPFYSMGHYKIKKNSEHILLWDGPEFFSWPYGLSIQGGVWCFQCHALILTLLPLFLRQLCSGVDTLKFVAELLVSIDRITDVTDKERWHRPTNGTGYGWAVSRTGKERQGCKKTVTPHSALSSAESSWLSPSSKLSGVILRLVLSQDF